MREEVSILLALCLLGTAMAQVKTDPKLDYRSTTLVGNPQCCGAKIMDSDRRVAIEISGELIPGNYSAVEVKFCELDQIHIQLWRLVREGTYELRWEIEVVPQQSHISQQSVIIDLEESIMITKHDRLGVYNPETGPDSDSDIGAKFSIPYDFSSSYSLYLSKDRQPKDQPLEIGDFITIDNLRWPRSYRGYITFCTQPNCPKRPGQEQVFIQGPPGPVGPPGPPGASNLIGLDDIIGEIGGACADTGELERTISSQNQKLSDLTDQMTQLNTIVRSITESSSVTSICASGFTAGSYGVPSCYLIYKEPVPFALAVLRCRADHGASLVSIETELEDRFLKNQIQKLFTASNVQESYWTAGMYNIDRKAWVWFDESRRTKSGMEYTNWRTVYPPQPPNLKIDVCSTLDVTATDENARWDMRACVESSYYICEVPKQCL